MAVALSAWLNESQYFTNTGEPLSGGQLFTYIAGSFSTEEDSFTSSAGDTANPQPLVLNSAGRQPNPIWLTVGQAYNLVLKDALNNILFSRDNVNVADPTVEQNPAPQFVTPTQGQTGVTIEGSYTPGANDLQVFYNGSLQRAGVDYIETGLGLITFTSALQLGDVVQIIHV